MKHLRVTASVDQDLAPPFYTMLSDSTAIRETRVLEWNTTVADSDTVLFAIDGDAEPFARDAPDTPGVASVHLSATDRRWTYALVEMQPVVTPMFDAIREARTRPGIVVRKPIVYRAGDMHFRVVGDPAALQNALDEAPDGVDVRVEEIGPFHGGPERPATGLSERQRDAVAVALELGYYDRPRTATHDDVADELGCAPPTASEHLQKAESKILQAVMDDLRRRH
jgi:predicted DNA binding protein